MKKFWLLIIVVLLAFVLRVFRLGDFPPSLYWDEASLGYNAYSIAQTLHDEHGEFLPLTRFTAFGDYKAPGYIYGAALSIKLLDLSDFTVRLPSALAGTLLVIVTYLLVKELFASSETENQFKTKSWTSNLPLISAIFVAVSPWSLQFSRGAFEANLATLFSGLGIYLFLRAVRLKSTISYLLSSISFVFSMYTFNSHRVFVPILIVALVLIFHREILSRWKKFLLFALLSLILLLPLAQYGTTREAQLRFQEVAWVNDLAPIQTANDRVARDGDSWWSKIIHNRRLVYAREFLIHYTDQAKASFLFYSGDVNARLSIQTVGEMYWLDLPFLLIGLVVLFWKWRYKSVQVLFAWLLIAPIPAALARETPHALRSLNLLPVPQIIVALGLVSAVSFLSSKVPAKLFKFLFIPGVILAYLLSGIFYVNDYYNIYPVKYASAWQYGYKQIVSYVASVQDQYSCISVTEYYGRPYIYFLLYNHYDPVKYWSNRNISRDWYGFWYVHSFDKYFFGDVTYPKQNCLYVRAPKDVPKGVNIVKTVDDLEGQPVFTAYTLGPNAQK